ncbi:MAG: hypothetical protein LBH57_04710 [Treponema sp.]|nr:hypothetical protein [Treponema sp.]
MDRRGLSTRRTAKDGRGAATPGLFVREKPVAINPAGESDTPALAAGFAGYRRLHLYPGGSITSVGGKYEARFPGSPV